MAEKIMNLFHGRINRTDWIIGKVYSLLILLVAFLFAAFIGNGLFKSDFLAYTILFVVYSVLFVLNLALDVRRLHDFDKDWQWVLVYLIPLAAIPYVLVLLFKGGDKELNRFGQPPVNRESIAMMLNRT